MKNYPYFALSLALGYSAGVLGVAPQFKKTHSTQEDEERTEVAPMSSVHSPVETEALRDGHFSIINSLFRLGRSHPVDKNEVENLIAKAWQPARLQLRMAFNGEVGSTCRVPRNEPSLQQEIDRLESNIRTNQNFNMEDLVSLGQLDPEKAVQLARDSKNPDALQFAYRGWALFDAQSAYDAFQADMDLQSDAPAAAELKNYLAGILLGTGGETPDPIDWSFANNLDPTSTGPATTQITNTLQAQITAMGPESAMMWLKQKSADSDRWAVDQMIRLACNIPGYEPTEAFLSAAGMEKKEYLRRSIQLNTSTDPAIISGLINKYLEADPDGSINMFLRQSAATLEHDVAAAEKLRGGLPESAKHVFDAYVSADVIVSGGLQQIDEALMQVVEKDRSMVADEIAWKLSKEGAQAVITGMTGQLSGTMSQSAISQVLEKAGAENPIAVLSNTNLITDNAKRDSVEASIMNKWIISEPWTASAYISSLPVGSKRDAGSAQIAQAVAREDSEAAAAWLGQIQDPIVRDATIKSIKDTQGVQFAIPPVE